MAGENVGHNLISNDHGPGRTAIHPTKGSEPSFSRRRTKKCIGPVMDIFEEQRLDSRFRISPTIAERHSDKCLILSGRELCCECVVALELIDMVNVHSL